MQESSFPNAYKGLPFITAFLVNIPFGHNFLIAGIQDSRFTMTQEKRQLLLQNLKPKKMKKLLFATLLLITIGSTAFASEETKVTYKMKGNFDAKFYGAENGSWKVMDNFIKVSFTMDDENFDAFYEMDGELVAVSNKIEFKKLPKNAIKEIKKNYASYKVTDSIEFDQDGTKSYFVSLEEGSQKLILKVSYYGEVNVYNGKNK